MVNLEPVKDVMKHNMVLIVLAGIAIILGNFFFKKLEKSIKGNSKQRKR